MKFCARIINHNSDNVKVKPVNSEWHFLHDKSSLKLRVCTDPEIIWYVMEFKVEILPVLKSLEVDLRYEKVGKKPW